jgi:hypothetical protein
VDSGQSQTVFAQRSGLGQAALRYWMATLRELPGMEPMRGRFVAIVGPAKFVPPLGVGRSVVVR